MDLHSVRPWHVKAEHAGTPTERRLYLFALRRTGYPLTADEAAELDTFVGMLTRDGLVVDYNPNTDEGWILVRRSARDDPNSIIRTPGTLFPRTSH